MGLFSAKVPLIRLLLHIIISQKRKILLRFIAKNIAIIDNFYKKAILAGRLMEYN